LTCGAADKFKLKWNVGFAMEGRSSCEKRRSLRRVAVQVGPKGKQNLGKLSHKEIHIGGWEEGQRPKRKKNLQGFTNVCKRVILKKGTQPKEENSRGEGLQTDRIPVKSHD